MFRRTLIAWSLIAVVTAALAAQSNDLEFFNTKVGATNAANIDGAPFADPLNPAASAGLQRTTLDLSYFLLAGLGSSSGTGHWINAGVAIPTNVGVFSASAHVATSPFSALNWGSFVDIHASFAKDIYEDLYFGAGVGFQAGTSSGFGLGADLGFIHKVGDLLIWRDFAWGVAVRGLGVAYTTSYGAMPSNFTPAIATNFKWIKVKDFSLGTSLDLSFPTFQNLQFTAGLDLQFFRTVGLQIAYNLDVARLANGTARSLPLSFGMSFQLGGATSDKDAQGNQLPFYQTSEFRPSLAIMPLRDNIWAFGLGLNMPIGVTDSKPPVAKYEVPATAYISPNFDGVQDNLEFPLKITDERYVKSFTFTVFNAQGRVVRVIKNKELRPEVENIGNLAERFVRVKKGVPTPDPLVWDGTDDAGAILADGTYTYILEATDDNNNLFRSEPKVVVVDTKVPTLGIKPAADNPNLAFSPRGDRPTLELGLTGSPEDKWTAEVSDPRGQVVRTMTFDKDLPAKAAWDGKDDAGTVVPDGVYSLRLKTTDRAGNTTVANLENILLIDQPTPVGLRADNTAFSPNGDSLKDTVAIAVQSNEQVKVETWKATLVDPNGVEVRSATGTTTLPRSILLAANPPATDPTRLDIALTNKDGKLLPEGDYTLKLDVLYINGNRPSAETPTLTLDLTPPKATVVAATTIFSPNGDGLKDTVGFEQKASPEATWKGLVRNAAGTTVRAFTWASQPEATLTWDGRDDAGKPVPDSRYSYILQSTDLAGNFGESAPVAVDLDTRPTSASLKSTYRAFSPNGDGKQDAANFKAEFQPTDGVASWRLAITNAGSDQVLFEQKGTGAPGADLSWSGSLASGRAAEGSYRAMLELVYAKGDNPKTYSQDFALDLTPPSARVTAADGNPAFSPDGDNVRDTLDLRQVTSSEELWTGVIRDSSGSVRRTYTFTGAAPNIVWDGTDQNGRALADGSYIYEISATDAAGNSGKATLENIKIAVAKTDLQLGLTGRAFSPNGDGVKDTIGFEPKADRKDGIVDWKLTILPAQGQAEVYSVSGKAGSGSLSLPTALNWDGKTSTGRVAIDGSYVATLSVRYDSGQTPSTKSLAFALDTAPPKATAFSNPAVFSPDGDSRQDRVAISHSGASTELQWTGIVYQGDFPANAAEPTTTIRKFTWSGEPPKSFEWDGTNAASQIVADGTYRYLILAIDEAGNRGASAPIDIMVDKRVPTIAIQANSRAFSPNSDGKLDTLSLSPTTSLRDGIAGWTVEIRAVANQAVVRTLTGVGTPPASLVWDGKNASNSVAADGDYQAIFSMQYLKGNNPRVIGETIALDTKAPTIDLLGQVVLFSPDGDGLKDNAILNQTSSAEELWAGEIQTGKGEVVKRFTWNGLAGQVVWNGLDQSNAPYPDGTYSYLVRATDAAGNSTTKRLDGLQIDNRPTPVLLTGSAKGFAPGTGRAAVQSMGFQSFVTLKDGIESWSLSFVNLDSNQIAKTLTGATAVPERFTWDGSTSDAKVQAAEGRYEARLTVTYKKGNRPVAASTPFVLDKSGPVAKVTAQPEPFSPDDDGIDDDLTLNLQVADPSGVQTWTLDILDPQGNIFISYSGVGVPTNRIVWNGKSRSGELVQSAEDYLARLTTADTLGNVAKTETTIPIDVLVIRDGDILRIRLPGIEFPANSENLQGVDTDKQAKNNKTLDRLAVILRKYGSYKITVEGHANITRYWDKVLAEKEQREELLPLSKLRAEAVRKGLITRGIAETRLDSVGVGAGRPLVDFADLVNVWKNRRVEFILRK